MLIHRAFRAALYPPGEWGHIVPKVKVTSMQIIQNVVRVVGKILRQPFQPRSK